MLGGGGWRGEEKQKKILLSSICCNQQLNFLQDCYMMLFPFLQHLAVLRLKIFIHTIQLIQLNSEKSLSASPRRCRNHLRHPPLFIYLPSFQFTAELYHQMQSQTLNHRMLDHSIPVCLCSLIFQHVSLVLYLLPPGTVIKLNVACEQD